MYGIARPPTNNQPPTLPPQQNPPPGLFASQFDDNGQLHLGSPHSPSSPSFRGSPSSAIRTPTSSESELLCLDPPYLVSRPATFPTPTLLVEVLSAHNLKVRPCGACVYSFLCWSHPPTL